MRVLCSLCVLYCGVLVTQLYWKLLDADFLTSYALVDFYEYFAPVFPAREVLNEAKQGSLMRWLKT
jgi:hypothetical protein